MGGYLLRRKKGDFGYCLFPCIVYTCMYRDKKGVAMITRRKTIQEAFRAEGIQGYQLDKFKLYNPDTYDRLTRQAGVDVGVAVKDYKRQIIASNKRA